MAGIRDNFVTIAVAVAAVIIPAVLFAAGSLLVGLFQEYYNNERMSVYSVSLFNPDRSASGGLGGALRFAISALDKVIAETDDLGDIPFNIAKEEIEQVLQVVDDTPREIAHVRLVNNTNSVLSNIELAPNKETLGYLGNRETSIFDPYWEPILGDMLKISIPPQGEADYIVLGWGNSYGDGLLSVSLDGRGVDIRSVDLATLSNPGLYYWETSALNIAVYCLAGLGLTILIVMVIATPLLNVTRVRRHLTTKKEFERMLGDVGALYSKFRPQEANPLFSVQESSSNSADEPRGQSATKS